LSNFSTKVLCKIPELTVKDDSCAFKNEVPYQISEVVNTRFLLVVHVSYTVEVHSRLTFEAITVFYVDVSVFSCI